MLWWLTDVWIVAGPLHISKLYKNLSLYKFQYHLQEWGHNFRAEYRRIGKFRDRYPNIPIMALTATATDAYVYQSLYVSCAEFIVYFSVQKDIIKSLKLSEEHLFRALHPFNRANLFYEVRYLSNPSTSTQMTDIFNYITTLYRRRGKASSGIVYCRMKKTCDDLASYLRGKGLNAKAYHRGIPYDFSTFSLCCDNIIILSI